MAAQDLAVATIVGALLVGYLVFYFRTIHEIVNSRHPPSTKGLWFLIVLVFQPFGAVAWYVSRRVT